MPKVETWHELDIATDFRDLVKSDPKAWEEYVNFEELDKYIEFLWEGID